MTILYQTTLKQEITFHGKALFTGSESIVSLRPTKPGTGIIFRRIDITGHPEIAAKTENVQEAVRSTKIGQGEASIQTIEHLMAALFACGIDNLIIEVSGPEIPIFDGSSLPFIELIERAGMVQQDATRNIYALDAPCHFSSGDMHLVALPSNDFRVSYTLHYPHSPYLQSQYFSSAITPDTFRREIAPCRTFTLYEDVEPLIQKGILKNAALEHGVVIDGKRVLNPEGVRFPDEMVRHKVLDLIGDIALLGFPLQVHLIGIKTGHAANHAIARAIAKQIRKSLRKT